MKINFSFYFLLFIFIFNSFNISYIVIPFNTYNKEDLYQKSEFDITKFYENNFASQIYALINIGTPKTLIPINLLMSSQGLIIGSLCNINSKIEESKYDINKSSSFYSDPNNRRIYYNYYKDSFIAQDSFSFYSDIKINSEKEIKLNNISFIYVPKENGNNLNNNFICGNLGLSLKAHYYLTDEVNFIKNLKKMNYINKYDFSFYFMSDNDGLLIIGEEPHNYFSNIYNINNLRKTNALSDGYDNISWKTEFAQIYFYSNDGKNKLKEKNGYFTIENNYIIGGKYYKTLIEEKFFKKYFDNNVCYYENISKEKYSILICDKNSNFDIEAFPTLYFYHRIFNYYFFLKIKIILFWEKYFSGNIYLYLMQIQNQ